MKIFNLILVLIFGITIIPNELIIVPIKYILIVPMLILVINNSLFLPKFEKSKDQVIFSQTIYLYVFGILISSIISGNTLSSSIIYTFLFTLRFLIIDRVCKKIDFFTILDSAALGVSTSFLICIFIDSSSWSLFQKLFTLQITNIASERLSLFGSAPNFAGVSAGLISLYIAIRIINEQYEQSNNESDFVGFINYNGLYGYSLLFLNVIILFLTNTRSAYLSIFVALLFQTLSILKRKKFIRNKNNKYYLLFLLISFLNFNRLLVFINKYITISANKYRGISSGLTGRVDIWKEKISLIGPIGYGYSPKIGLDNNYLYSAYSSGLLFCLPLFLFYIYYIFKTIQERSLEDINYIYRLELNIKSSLLIYLFIHLFLDQQTIGQTSLISFIFVILPLSQYSINKKIIYADKTINS